MKGSVVEGSVVEGTVVKGTVVKGSVVEGTVVSAPAPLVLTASPYVTSITLCLTGQRYTPR